MSPCEILKYFLSNNIPVINESTLSKCHLMSEREWLNFIEPLQGSIVTHPGKRPASIRLDQLDRDQINSNLKKNSHIQNTQYPLIIHFSMFRNTWLPLIKNNMKLKKLYHKYFKLRHLLNNKSKLTLEDKTNLRILGDELQELIRKSTDVQKEIMVELSAENFRRTGIRTDLIQFSVLIPTFIEHLRFHTSLKFLENKIGYTFKNRLLLQHAMTHPSGAFLLHQNLGSNPDHIRNCLFNCKARNPNYGTLTSHKRKSLLRKKGIHMLFSIMSQKETNSEESSQIANYERLEFLGDKILELLTSHHLFFMFPQFDEGKLSEYRNVIVQNQYLAVLARKLDLHYFIIFYHGVDLCSNSALNHALANSFEALLAAIYLDSNLETVSKMLGKILWDEEDLYETWVNIRPHPIQAQLPAGDRHLIPNTKILQHVSQFENLIGYEFNHIRLLAQAFCTRSASFNLITLGDNQRLEFLGDTVLNFVVSDYLYRHFPNHHEGHLSLLRSSLVCNSTQALLYDELGMADYVLASTIKPENSGNLKRKADVFEAFIGALYVDQNLEPVKICCNVCMFNKLKDIILYQFWHDPKSRLQQCCLSLRDVDDSKPSLPVYKLIEEKGPPNHKQYRVAVYFNRKRIGEGIGKSIHDAEIEAAKHALKTNKDMFPILNKYIASEIKNSEYIKDFDQATTTTTSETSKKKRKKKNKKTKIENANITKQNI
ncbi:unnamed protein product [Brachionus calyciflorus]|uniref:Drosha n=1 Tax=Brachionus calyciflorus TaxID=104777 RepID=A0A813YQF2_9BILA|nr:unnamed protein product [Brachionus calyciflorus]